MVVIIGVRLCLIELRYLSGRNGVRSSGLQFTPFSGQYLPNFDASAMPQSGEDQLISLLTEIHSDIR
jgi:hypothetical protein